MTVFEPWQPTMTGDGLPERLEGQSVSTGFFGVLGIAPRFGRDFVASEEGPHAPRLVILSDRLWRQRIGGTRTKRFQRLQLSRLHE